MKLKLPHKIIIGIGSFLLIYGATFAGLKILDKQKVAEVNIDVSSGEVSVHNAYMETADGFYVGEIIGNTFEGKGQYNFLSGEIYTGDWLNSKMDGDGRMVFEGVGIYDGEYTDSLRGGYGVFTWNNGDVYKGVWQEDKMNGKGEYTFADGSVLSGTFANNRIEAASLR